MSEGKFSINRACAVGIAFLGLLSIVTIISTYLFVRNPAIVWLCLLFILLVFSCAALFVVFLRRKLVLFSDNLCQTIDDMLNGVATPPQIYEEESLFYKINHRLVRLYEVLRESQKIMAKERADLQELISDISHQVKTLISNLKMVNATLLEQPMPEEKQREFLQASSGQLEKLDFLMQAMIKTSRLETGVISLDRKIQPLYDTLTAALGGILLNAERKNIHVSVDCPTDIALSHDGKWTSEALFNILDNAVKYTPSRRRYSSFRPKLGVLCKNRHNRQRQRNCGEQTGDHLQTRLPGRSTRHCGHRNRTVPGPRDHHHAGRIY